MSYWLLKTEPADYSFQDLVKEKITVWDGVRNKWALKFMRTMRKGDQVFVYHSGKEKKIVGLASVVSEFYPDPHADDPNLGVVDLKVEKKLSLDIPLKQLKEDHFFADFLLVKFTRLSVMPVEPKFCKKIMQLAGEEK
jgi:predicted RNA-binding protein with PUA-like domain